MQSELVNEITYEQKEQALVKNFEEKEIFKGQFCQKLPSIDIRQMIKTGVVLENGTLKPFFYPLSANDWIKY